MKHDEKKRKELKNLGYRVYSIHHSRLEVVCHGGSCLSFYQVIYIHTRYNEYTEQAAYMALNKNIIDPLLEWKFITVNKQGAHHTISLTDEGRNALKFLNVE